MEKDTNIIVRVNSILKKNVANIANERGISFSKLINAFMLDIYQKGKIPTYLNKFLTPLYIKENELSIAKIKRIVTEIIEKQEKKSLIQKIYLFGSYARGDETEKSDIDIRIEADKGLGLIDIGNWRLDIAEATGKDVDLLVVHPESMDQEFYKKIKKEQICIYER